MKNLKIKGINQLVPSNEQKKKKKLSHNQMHAQSKFLSLRHPLNTLNLIVLIESEQQIHHLDILHVICQTLIPTSPM